MGFELRVALAVFRKDMRQYLGNPTGYVFLTLFVMTTAAAAFLMPGFFERNLADLSQLNQYMAWILMFFVPALTMSAWADERRAGTDEFLLTMPVRDSEVVVGKYLGVVGMLTISLGFSLANVVVLRYLGEPDMGLMASTYLGYWMLGVLFCAIGLVASMLSNNAPVAFILGLLGCAALVMTGTANWAGGVFGGVAVGMLAALVTFVVTRRPGLAGIGGLVGGVSALFVWVTAFVSGDEEKHNDAFAELFGQLSVTDHVSTFGEGVIRIGDLVYFGAGVAVLLYLATFLLGRRHW